MEQQTRYDPFISSPRSLILSLALRFPPLPDIRLCVNLDIRIDLLPNQTFYYSPSLARPLTHSPYSYTLSSFPLTTSSFPWVDCSPDQIPNGSKRNGASEGLYACG